MRVHLLVIYGLTDVNYASSFIKVLFARGKRGFKLRARQSSTESILTRLRTIYEYFIIRHFLVSWWLTRSILPI